jgi:phage protein U
MLASLSTFIFKMNTIPYHSVGKSHTWRHPTNAVVNSTARGQFTGREAETRDISATLYPELTGGRSSIATLIEMADRGEAYLLMSGQGLGFKNEGFWVITDIKYTESALIDGGHPQKIDFSMSLRCADVHDTPASLSDLALTVNLVKNLR